MWHICHDFNSDLAKLRLKLWYGWIIISRNFQSRNVDVITYPCSNFMLVSWNKRDHCLTDGILAGAPAMSKSSYGARNELLGIGIFSPNYDTFCIYIIRHPFVRIDCGQFQVLLHSYKFLKGRAIEIGTADIKLSAWRQSLYYHPISNLQLLFLCEISFLLYAMQAVCTM